MNNNNEDISVKIGKLLRYCRKNLKLTQEEMQLEFFLNHFIQKLNADSTT